MGILRAGLCGWSLALLLPLSVLGFSYGCVWLTGIAVFIVPDQIGSVFSFVLDLVLSVAIIALTAAFGEEIGWRGYLLPHLMGLGFRRALLLSGLLHGLWHLPILIWTPFYHVMGNRFIIIPLFLLTLTVVGVCYGYLRLTTASVWPPAIAHSAFNSFWERFNTFTVPKSSLALEYLSGESGILTLGALTMLAWWLLHRLDEKGIIDPTGK